MEEAHPRTLLQHPACHEKNPSSTPAPRLVPNIKLMVEVGPFPRPEARVRASCGGKMLNCQHQFDLTIKNAQEDPEPLMPEP